MPRAAPLLLALCAAAVAALAAGPFLYRSLLPDAAAPAGCSFALILGGLFALLVAAAIWLLRRGRQAREPDLDRRLWEAALDRDEAARPGSDER